MALNQRLYFKMLLHACEQVEMKDDDERMVQDEIWVSCTVHIEYRTNLVIQRQSILL